MHDAFGKPLKAGDVVVLPCIIKSCSEDNGFCNVTIESVIAMPGNAGTPGEPGAADKGKLSIGALNTRQVIRANKEDDSRFTVSSSHVFKLDLSGE